MCLRRFHQGMAGSHRPRSQGQPPPHAASVPMVMVNEPFEDVMFIQAEKLYLVWLSKTFTSDAVDLFRLPDKHMQIAQMLEVS